MRESYFLRGVPNADPTPGTLGRPTQTREQRLLARQGRMAHEQEIARLTTEVAELSKLVKDNQLAYQAEMLEMITLMTSAMERVTRSLRS